MRSTSTLPPELLEDFFYKAAGGVGLEVERTEAQECLADTVAIHAKKFIADAANVEFGMLQKAFANMLPEGGRILDLGCGSGRDSLAFLKAGLAVDAVDGSAEMVKAASELIGLRVEHATFADFKPKGGYDGIWACSSLLHVPATELPAIVAKYAAALKPAERMVHSQLIGAFCQATVAVSDSPSNTALQTPVGNRHLDQARPP